MTQRTRFVSLCVAVGLVSGLGSAGFGYAAESSAEKQAQLIKVLQSDASPGEKAIACKRLAVYGGKDAVEALAPLLANSDLASWARIALEPNPEPSAGVALRSALTKLDGKLLVGVINSLGVRRDAQAVEALAEKLKYGDAEVASAAAEALGRIGGAKAAAALEQALDTVPAEVRTWVAYGGVVCAERFHAEGKSAQAVALYDKIRQANVPRQRVLEATRGAILARQADGLPLLLEQLKSSDKARFGIGLRTARELPGRVVTEAIAAEMERANPERQKMLLLALSDRTDDTVLPKLLQVARNGSKPLRSTAIGLLDRHGDLVCVPVLLDAAMEQDAELARPAKAALARMGGKEVEADLLARMPEATGKKRQVLIDLARQRRIEGALPVVLKSMEDSDAAVRRAAVEAVGVLGTHQQVDNLGRLLSRASTDEERENIERALVAICGRDGAKSLPSVMPLTHSTDKSSRVTALRALATIGGPEALTVVKTTLRDKDLTVQDEAVSTLANWPNSWPDDAGVAEPLLTLAKTGGKPTHQLQGLRGYLLYVQETKQLKTAEKLARLNEVWPVIKSPEEKRLAIAALGSLPSSGAVERLTALMDDSAVSEEAALAIVRIATESKQSELAKEVRQQALQTVIQKAKSDATRKRAEDGLKRLK